MIRDSVSYILFVSRDIELCREAYITLYGMISVVPGTWSWTGCGAVLTIIDAGFVVTATPQLKNVGSYLSRLLTRSLVWIHPLS